jgi:phosphatidylserine/phosphatidylglycerophosphate/cardiolipin synthase-like enzyme
MPDAMKRTETIHVSEEKRTSSSSSQWLLEKQHATHPICDNNEVKVFICGEEGFKDIAAQIEAAKESIDICCWGFDPAMELVRESGMWPRGPTYGDLLIAAGKRIVGKRADKHVAVRLLVWYDGAAAVIDSMNPRNMPGYTHDTSSLRDAPLTEAASEALSAKNSLALAEAAGKVDKYLTMEQIHIRARRDYCRAWYMAAFRGWLKGVQIRTRAGDTNAVKKSLASELQPPDDWSKERGGMTRFGTHHQKPILIDFYYNDGAKAVGYVMGLNSVTDYWDTAEHKFEDSRRERELARSYKPDLDHYTMKPFRDYACRIDRGRALVALYTNFVKAWERAEPDKKKYAVSELGSRAMPKNLWKPAPTGSPQVQILRTQPEEGDKTIKDLYLNATDLATRAAGYLYLENQYFQWEEWAQRLLRVRKQSMKQWNASRTGAGLPLENMPVMHVFIVIPVPEQEGMIPRTYDTLATLGQQAHMGGQAEMIKNANEHPQHQYAATGFGPAVDMGVSVPEVVEHANKISKPDAITLETQFGIKVCTAMLNACGSDGKRFNYREIYIHSKLLLIDDTFFTLGSANLNQRSMAVDSEINVATVDPVCARDLRKRIWGQLSGKPEGDGGGGSRAEIAEAFSTWVETMDANDIQQKKGLRMTGFLLPLADKRSSTSRVG